MQLRQYQQEAVDAVWNHIRNRNDNPCVVLPTGAGKGVVLSELARQVVEWSGRIVIVAHVKELLEQTAGNIMKMAPEIPVGIYSAGLKSRDLGYPVTVAGIQSIYDKAEQLGPVNIIAIDEAHRIPPDGEGMYRTFLEAAKKINPDVKLIGLTATPYRMSTGMICAPDNLLNQVCYEIGVRKLIVDGYLSPLRSKATDQTFDTSNVSIRGGEFVQGELEKAMASDEMKVAAACYEIVEKTVNRKSVIVFCSGVAHAQMVAQMLTDIAGTDLVRTVFGDTQSDERARTVADFKSGKVSYLVNVDVLTTGFDAPAVDCVSILRPTMSPGLFYQMVGRGFRLAPGKKDCLVLDFGGNLLMHGPVDRMVISEDKKTGQVGNGGARFKKCPKCAEMMPVSCEVCPDCGEKLPREKRGIGHEATAATQEALSGPENVLSIVYQRHEKKIDEKKTSVSLRVNYDCGMMWPVSEFLCFEHKGFAQTKAAEWWRARSSEPVPRTIDEALRIIAAKGIQQPKQLILKSEGKYLRVEKYLGMAFETSPNVWFGDLTSTKDDKAFANG